MLRWWLLLRVLHHLGVAQLTGDAANDYAPRTTATVMTVVYGAGDEDALDGFSGDDVGYADDRACAEDYECVGGAAVVLMILPMLLLTTTAMTMAYTPMLKATRMATILKTMMIMMMADSLVLV